MNGTGGLKLEAFMSDDMILSLIASASEFDQIKVSYILSVYFIRGFQKCYCTLPLTLLEEIVVLLIL